MSDRLLTALPISIFVVLALLYLSGVARAYLAAGERWKTMDRDVKMVFLLVVPLFRAGVAVLMVADWIFYRPTVKFTSDRRPPLAERLGS